MKKIGVFFLTLLFCVAVTTDTQFAQTKPEQVEGGIIAQSVTSSPTTTPQPGTKPTPETTQAPAPTADVANFPTKIPAATQPTAMLHPTQGVQKSEPTAAPKPTMLTPTPTSTPIPLRVINSQQPPLGPISSIISAPFDLFMNALPQNYYNEQGQGLAPVTNRILLMTAALCLLTGTFLLSWPSISRLRKNRFIPSLKERRAFPYIAGKA